MDIDRSHIPSCNQKPSQKSQKYCQILTKDGPSENPTKKIIKSRAHYLKWEKKTENKRLSRRGNVATVASIITISYVLSSF